MHFLIIAKDGVDPEAPRRREAARAKHLENIDASLKNVIMAGATFDARGKLDGSALIVDFPSRVDLVEWLQTDPYVMQDVWQSITIQPFRPAPSFEKGK